MKKQLNILILTLLILSQTILGPVGTVWASEDNGAFADDIVENNSADETGYDDPSSNEVDKDGEDTDSSVEQENGDSDDLDSDGEDENSSEDGEITDPSEGEGNTSEEGEEDASECEEGTKDNASGDDDNNSECEKIGEEEGPSKTPSGSFDPVMSSDVIRGVEFTVNGETLDANAAINVQNGDKAYFKFNVSYNAGADGGNYGEGTTLTYELPEIFEGLELPGGTAFGSIGTLSVQGRSVIITFNEELNGNAPIEGADGELYAYFEVAASFSATNADWEKTIHLPGENNFTLNFQPKGGDTVTKIGTPDNGGKNSKFIDWTVMVNTNLGATGEQNFIDELEGEHTFVIDPNTIIVREIPITPNGPGSTGDIVLVMPNFENGNKKMTILLPDKPHTGYEITYQTEVGDPGNVPSAKFKNKATYNGISISDDPQVTFGDPLAKSHSGPGIDLITTWTINYNFNNRNISQEKAKLEDTWTVSGGSGTLKHALIQNSFKVFEEDGTTVVNENQYTMTPKDDGNGFYLSFNQAVTKPYVIKYQTEPNGVYPTKDYSVKNIVERIDMENKIEDTAEYGKKELLLSKTTNGIDYGNKTMSWKVVANQAGYPLPKNTQFVDTYGEPNLTLKEETLIVKIGNDETTDYTLSYMNDEHGRETGFIITLTNTTDKVVEITYTTDYRIKDSGKDDRDRTYKNTVTIKKSDLPSEPSDSATQTIIEKQKKNGKKDGHYDYGTKTFHWDVELNFNYNTLQNAVFEDELPETQKVESITVTEGTLNAKGDFIPSETKTINNSLDADHKIKLELGHISVPYKVTYTSKDTDDVFPHGSGTLKVKNSAKLSSEVGENATWEKTVEVNYTDKIFKKSGEQSARGSALINWNFEFNYAQSKLDNVVITDTVGQTDSEPDQLILDDSFKVYKVTLTGKTPSNPVVKKDLVDPEDYSLIVDVKNGVFTLSLGDVDGAYYVEYETIFTGSSGSNVQNDVAVKYSSTVGESGSDQAIIANFKYGNNADTMKVPFVIIKTDAATGEVMVDVEFALYGPYTGDRVLFTGKTDANGVLDFGVKFAEGDYTLKETKVEGYKNPDIPLELDRDKRMTGGIYVGKQIVEVKNEKTEGLVCTDFKLTIKDVDRNPVASKDVILTNKVTGVKNTVPSNQDGEIMFSSSEVKAGEYTVTINEDGTDVELGEVKVRYDGDCEGFIQPNPSCNAFTITIIDKDNKPRPNVPVTLKHKLDTEAPEITASTDSNGEFTVPIATTQTGTYKVYEGKQYLGEVTITYKKDPCVDSVTEAKTCESFTLTVKDVDGNLRGAGVKITIRDKEGHAIATGTTDAQGETTINTPLPAGEYDVFEDDSTTPFDEFAVNINCEAEVQPKPVCTDFTITVIGGNNQALPFTHVAVKKDKNGSSVYAAVTDKDGKIAIPSDKLSAGQYFVFAGELFVKEITVSYLDNCQATANGAPVCEDFTLTVQDVNGNARPAIDITVKDSTGNIVFTGMTDINGQIKTDSSLYQGAYTVYEGTSYINSFTVTNTCAAIVKPRPSGGGWNPPTPDTEDPNKPDLEDPNKPETEDPNKPGTEEPNKPGTEDPNKPGIEDPSDPGTEDPDKPGTGDPSDLGTEDPNKPGKEDPSESGNENPNGSTSPGKSTNDDKSDGTGKKPSKPGQSGVSKNTSSTLNSGSTLPQTGEAYPIGSISVGIALILLGGWMLSRRRKTSTVQ